MINQQIQDQLDRHLSFLAQDENNLSLLIKISDLYIELEDLDSAQIYIDKASLINPVACLGHQGLIHLNQGQLTQAKEYFIKAISNEDAPALRYNLGFTYFISSDMENATKSLAPILENEQHPEAKLLMGRIYHYQGDLDKAIVLVMAALQHSPDNSEALGLLALLQFDMDEGELAAQTALQALAINPDNYDAKLINAMSRLATQETTVEEVESLLQINPDDCRLWFALGSVHMTQGAMELAEYSLKKAVEIYPEFYDCYIALGWCLLLQNNIDEAFGVYEIAADLVPELADAWGGQALTYALKEDLLTAEELIQKSINLNSDCFLAEIAQTIYFNHKNPTQASEHLVKALKSSNTPASEKLAFIIKEMQDSMQLH